MSMSIQPFHSHQRLIVEPRDDSGKLLFGVPEPPSWMLNCNLDLLYWWAFGLPEHLGKRSLAWEDLHSSLRQRNWAVRVRYW